MEKKLTNSSDKEWYQKKGWIILLIIVFFPVGLYLMWTNDIFSNTNKILITMFFALVIIIDINLKDSKHNITKNGITNLNHSINIESVEDEDEEFHISQDILNKKKERDKFISKIQKRLNNLGYKITIDGIYGNNTKKAIKQFQKKYNLKSDGILGQKTYKKLIENSRLDNIKQRKIAKQETNKNEQKIISCVGKSIAQNKLGVTSSDLKIKGNPKGEGVFVYVKKTRYSGIKRYIIWLVINSKAYTLNSPSKMVTPSLPWPREADEEIWKKTGINKYTGAKEAIDIIYR